MKKVKDNQQQKNPMAKKDDSKKYYTVQEIAKHLSLTESWIYKLKAANKIPYTQIEGKILFDINQINEWLKEKSFRPVNG